MMVYCVLQIFCTHITVYIILQCAQKVHGILYCALLRVGNPSKMLQYTYVCVSQRRSISLIYSEKRLSHSDSFWSDYVLHHGLS